MTRSLASGLCAVLLAVAGGCGGSAESSAGAPHIDSLAPTQAAKGATIEVVGVRFCGPAATDVKADDSCAALPSGVVSFGVAPGAGADAGADVARGQVVSWKGTHIQVKVPTTLASGACKVVVTVNGLGSNARDFTITP